MPSADPKSVDPKNDNSRIPADNSKSDKTSATTKNVPEKKFKRNKTQETQIENIKTTEDINKTVETQEKPTQTTVNRDELLQISKSQPSFNIQTEIAKLKIPIPLTELVKNDLYKSTITETLNMNDGEDAINLNDHQPELIFGLDVNGKNTYGSVPPFYISLTIHYQILHNAFLDSGASHNFMPKATMETLNLEITRPYKDLF